MQLIQVDRLLEQREKFYLDKDVPIILAQYLQNMGHDVNTSRWVKQADAPESENLLMAAREGRILVSHNAKDYLNLQDTWRRWSNYWGRARSHFGIILIASRGPRMYEDAAEALSKFVASSPDLTDQLYRWSREDIWYKWMPEGGWRRYPLG